jgi:hypothetical protein
MKIIDRCCIFNEGCSVTIEVAAWAGSRTPEDMEVLRYSSLLHEA